MSKMIKKKKNKGFTLIEILVAVLILSLLVAIAVPLYTRAVERSRTADPINTLKSIAKAEQVQRLRVGEYTNQTQELDLEVREYPAGNTVAGDTFDGQYYTYKVYGEDEAAATATRKTTNPDEEYELSVDYGTGELFCRPATHRICMDLGLEEGQYYGEPPWENCAGQVDNLWRTNFGVSDTKENRGITCQVRENTKNNVTDFDFCIRNKNTSYQLVYGVATNAECLKGSFVGDNKMELCSYYASIPNTCFYRFIEKVGDRSYVDIIRNRYDEINQTYQDSTATMYNWKNGQLAARALCTEFDSNNNCLAFTCQQGDCSVFNR